MDELIKNDRQITQNRIADIVGMSQESRVHYSVI